MSTSQSDFGIQPDERGTFRDHIATVDEKGGRAWIYPKKPKGSFYNARTLVSYILLIILFGGPFLTINGHPALLLNILERKFYILGMIFWPQDFYLFGLGVIMLIIAIILFTAIFGRIFCGWICPQTLFMEMVFRKIEYIIEGDASTQRKLNNSPLGWEKFWKKTLKLSTFYALSFVIGNTFLAYIIGKDELFKIITEPVSEHFSGFFAIVIFSFVFFGVFAWFREQACVIVCPYGRFQSVLLDPNSIVVHYDFIRGEPRGKGKRRNNDLGDCIDCHQCVYVCPTGIDIRNGTQLECVNCTACIDSCNSVMTKIDKPKGLIRYASYNSIKDGDSKIFNTRTIGYSVILVLITLFFTFLMAIRSPIELTILRTPGVLYHLTDEGTVKNVFNMKVINKSYEIMEIDLRLISPDIASISLVKSLVIGANELDQSVFFIDIPQKDIHETKIPIQLEILGNGEILSTIKTVFISPDQ